MLPVVDTPDEESQLVTTRQENKRLSIENEGLRKENEGLKQLLSEWEKVVALLAQGSVRRKHYWQRWRGKDDSE